MLAVATGALLLGAAPPRVLVLGAPASDGPPAMVVPEADGPPPLVNTIMSWPMATPTATLEPTPTAQDEADQQARDTAGTAAENESEPSSQ